MRPQRCTVRPSVVVGLVGVSVVLLSACGGLPKRGSDTARVAFGPPRVTSRERYISDRSNDLAWLRQQLEPSVVKEYEQGTQAGIASFVSDLNALGIKVRADLTGPLAAPGGEQQPTSAATAAGEGDGGNGSGEQDARRPLDPDKYAADTASDSLTQFHKLTGEQIEALVRATRPDISATPSERLDDRLAFRDSVRTAIRQRDLDDTHDLYGNTLHELTFDLSLVPGRDAGSPYVVLVTAKRANDPGCLGADARAAMADALRREAIYETVRRGDVITRRHDTSDTLAWYAELEAWPMYLDGRTRLDAAAERLVAIIEAARDACTLSVELNGETEKTRLAHAGQIASEIARLPDFVGVDRAQIVERVLRLSQRRTCALPAHLPKLVEIRKRCAATRDDAHTRVLHGMPIPGDMAAQIAADREFVERVWEGLGGEFDDLRVIDAIVRVRPQLPTDADSLLDLTPLPPPTDDASAVAAEAAKDWGDLNRALLEPIGGHQLSAMMNYSAESLRTVKFSPEPGSLADLIRGGREKFDEGMARLLDARPDPDCVRAWQLELAAVSVARAIGQRSGNWLAARCDDPVVQTVIAANPKDGTPVVATLPRLGPHEGQFTRGLLERMRERQRQSPVRIIGIAPTEQVQQLGVDLSSLVGRAINADIAAILGSQVAGGARMQRLREELLRISQLERQPIVVGFVGATDADASAQTFGWVLGPRFEARQPGFNPLSPGGAEEWERQIAVHHPVTATIVCPAWVDSLTLEARAYRISAYGEWIPIPLSVSDDGVVCRDVPCAKSGKDRSVRTLQIALPVDGDAFARWVLYGNDRRAGEPTVLPPTRIVDARTGEYRIDWALTAGQKNSMTIRGRHLWRNPEVYVGGVKAASVLPMADLNGLFVTFDETAPLRPGRQTLIVATSAGAVEIPDAVEVVRTAAALPKATLKTPGALVRDKKTTLVLTLDRDLTDYGGFLLRVRRQGESGAVAEVSDLGAFKPKTARELTADVTFNGDISPGVHEVDLFLLRTPRSDPARISATELVLLLPAKTIAEPVFEGSTPPVKEAPKIAIAEKTVLTYSFGPSLTWADVAKAVPGLEGGLAKATFKDSKGSTLGDLAAVPVKDRATAAFTVTARGKVEFEGTSITMLIDGVPPMTLTVVPKK